MNEKTVADVLLESLAAKGVTHLFGYPGGAILPFYDALPHHPEIQHILVRHEQGAAFMAGGWARSRREVGVCCATSGPGATNLVTGIADAYMDSVPVLAITGQVTSPMIGKDAFQEVNIVGICEPITKWSYQVQWEDDIAALIDHALNLSTTGRPGPVVLDIPKDIMASEYAPTGKTYQLKAHPKTATPTTVPRDSLINIASGLRRAKRPILLGGQGLKHANAESVLNTLVTTLNIPTVTTLLGKGTLAENHPSNLGWLGMHGYYHSNMAMHHADFILNIGSRFDDRIVGTYDQFGQGATIAHVDIDDYELNKVVETDYPVHCDAKAFIEQLLHHIGENSLAINPWWDQINTWRDDHPIPDGNTAEFTIQHCLKHLEACSVEHLSSSIFVTDVGQHQMWSSSLCRVAGPDRWLTSGGAGTMGFALPSAIGAAMAHPDKTVYCITGDGGFQMNMQELSLLKEHNLNVKVLVMNNRFLGMVRQWQELFYDHNYSSVNITMPDLDYIAKAYGLPYQQITAHEELNTDHDVALRSECPTIIEYCVAKEDNVLPMVPSGQHLGQTIATLESTHA